VKRRFWNGLVVRGLILVHLWRWALRFVAGAGVSRNALNLSTCAPEQFPMPITSLTRSVVGTLITDFVGLLN